MSSIVTKSSSNLTRLRWKNPSKGGILKWAISPNMKIEMRKYKQLKRIEKKKNLFDMISKNKQNFTILRWFLIPAVSCWVVFAWASRAFLTLIVVCGWCKYVIQWRFNLELVFSEVKQWWQWSVVAEACSRISQFIEERVSTCLERRKSSFWIVF